MYITWHDLADDYVNRQGDDLTFADFRRRMIQMEMDKGAYASSTQSREAAFQASSQAAESSTKEQ
jgi:hypothetical protein